MLDHRVILRQKERDEINKHIEQFLKAGGVIKVSPSCQAEPRNDAYSSLGGTYDKKES